MKLPDKDKARALTRSFIRKGILIRLPCEVCGKKKVDSHHTDYSQPKKIMWLCRKHHALWHSKNGYPPGISREGDFFSLAVRRSLGFRIREESEKRGMSIKEFVEFLVRTVKLSKPRTVSEGLPPKAVLDKIFARRFQFIK